MEVIVDTDSGHTRIATPMIEIILGSDHGYTYGGVFGAWRNVTGEALRTRLADLKLSNMHLVEY